jgi:putative flippase GtrA
MSYVSRLAQRIERLGLPLPKSLILFVCVGLTGLAVHTAVFSLLFRSRWLNYSEAWLTALATATLVTWSLNRRFTFADSGRHGGWEILRYALVTVLAQSVSYAVSRGLLAVAPQLPPELAVIMGAVAATAFSYTGQRFFTFAPAREVQVVAVGDTPVLVQVADRARTH